MAKGNSTRTHSTRKNDDGCRFCKAPLQRTFVDLGMSPLCENVRRPEDLDKGEMFYPLHAWVCEQCWLVQLREYVKPEQIFSEYAYFSSVSDSWVAHARRYADAMVQRFGLGPHSQVIEVASNDGYLLQHFVRQGIPVLGIEPAANVAKVAAEKGIPCVVKFFGTKTAQELTEQGMQADLLLGNNVLAHVPDLNDFVAGLKKLLSRDGVITLEFPHLLRLIERNQFDTVYHEHYSYLSLVTVERVMEFHGLRLFDVEQLSTHGGSLRAFACHQETQQHSRRSTVDALIAQELAGGLQDIRSFAAFQEQVIATKLQILEFLIDAKRQHKKVVGYGAPGKGVTLLHYCGIDSDLLEYTVDRNLYKQGSYLPGTTIHVYDPRHIFETRPDYIFILPWNLRDEIIAQMSAVRDWGARFVVPIPNLEIV